MMLPPPVPQPPPPPVLAPAATVRGGVNVRVSDEAGGARLARQLPTVPLHPWAISRVWWNDKLPGYAGAKERGKWCVQIFPGFVNGIDPLAFGFGVDGTVGVQGKTVASRRQAIGQATAEAAGFVGKPTVNLQGAWYPLLNGPHIALTALRDVPGEGENAPAYLAQMGVLEKVAPSGISINSASATIRVDPDKFFNGVQVGRPCVAVDLWLSVARASLTSDITVTNPLGFDGVQIDYSIGLDTSRVEQVGVRPRLQQGTYEDQRPPTISERLRGVWNDPQEDIHPLATLYFVGPTKAEGPPTEAWLPFFKYNLFWNLAHAPRNRIPPRKPPPITLLVPPSLGAGLLVPIANQVFSGLNQYSDLVWNALNNTTNEGKFWTV